MEDPLKQIMSAMRADPAGALVLPRLSIDVANKTITILEQRDLQYGKHVTITLFQGCVVSLNGLEQVTFSQPYPKVRAKYFITWDGLLRGAKHNAATKTIVIQIDGLPDQTISYAQ